MTGTVEKIKEVLHVGNNSSSTTGTNNSSSLPEGTAGPHGSRAANTADPRVDSDIDNRAQHSGVHTGVSSTGANTSTNAGPHNSNMLNKADPRVDSDLDNRGQHASAGVGGTSAGLSGTTGSTSTNAGPHNSNMLNKADPRVDSDLDRSKNAGMNQHTNIGGAGYDGTSTGNTVRQAHTGGTTGGLSSTTGAYSGSTGTSNQGYDGTHAGSHTTGRTSGTHAHNSKIANEVDPRVNTNTQSTGMHTGVPHHGTNTDITATHGGSAGGISSSTNAGPHNSNMANKADPRVDSDLDGRGNRTGASTGGITGASGSHATPGSGTAQNTAGPHNSDMMNKMDPRVDSNLDGSKTVGGNKTHASTSSAPRDPTDAAQVPPSVLAETIGAPTVTHGDAAHNHSGHHGSVSHQESHISGI